MNRKVVFYGAFDRYNYGDNLMPLLLEVYLKKFHSDKIDDVDFIFSSIKSSDLSHYLCKPTIAMTDLLSIEKNSTIIIVGGEVLGADIGVLYTHVQKSFVKVKLIKIARRFVPSLVNRIARNAYGAVWDYPYIPNKASFLNKIKIVYNTVGGIPEPSQKESLYNSDYISVRDQRTFDAVSNYCKANLVPDSVLMASGLIDLDFIETKVRGEIKDVYSNKNYITVQACPYKVEFTANELANELEKFSDEQDVILLPIGYASGHDDIIFMNKVKLASNNKFIVLDDLNVWEIMYLIIKSNAFYGTSLHGVITAMSFGIPHFCINEKISKLTSFLNTWSVLPYSKPLKVDGIHNSFLGLQDLKYRGEVDAELNDAVKSAQKIIFNSLEDISDLL